jgi:hypothetical protein
MAEDVEINLRNRITELEAEVKRLTEENDALKRNAGNTSKIEEQQQRQHRLHAGPGSHRIGDPQSP